MPLFSNHLNNLLIKCIIHNLINDHKGVHMKLKSIISVGLLIGSLGYAQLTLARCDYPKMNFVIPNGATATMENMVAGQTNFKSYNADMEAYLDCLDSELSKISKDLDNYQEIQSLSDNKYNAAVDQLGEAADQWNAAVRAYKAQ